MAVEEDRGLEGAERYVEDLLRHDRMRLLELAYDLDASSLVDQVQNVYLQKEAWQREWWLRRPRNWGLEGGGRKVDDEVEREVAFLNMKRFGLDYVRCR